MSQSRVNRFSFPSAFELAVLLSLLVIGFGAWLTPTSLADNLHFWGRGLWSLLAFMAQMTLILLFGYVLAKSPSVESMLVRLASWPRRVSQCVALSFTISALCCYLNWGMGLVASALFAGALLEARPELPRSLILAASYMGFLVWHGGLSGSIPLAVSTPGHFTESLIGVIPLQQTLFSSLNVAILASSFIALLVLILFLSRDHNQPTEAKIPTVHLVGSPEQKCFWETWCEQSRFSQLAHACLLLMIVSSVGLGLARGVFLMDLNGMILLVFALGLLLHGGLEPFSQAAGRGAYVVAPLLIQYPLYGGIMGVMTGSGLAQILSEQFVRHASPESFPVLTFWSAGLVNLLIPSGGGQWAVQAPVVLESAKNLGVPIEKAVLAVAWGDAWTNLVQPFWALPLLSLLGGSLRDLWKICAAGLVVSGLVISACFYFL